MSIWAIIVGAAFYLLVMKQLLLLWNLLWTRERNYIILNIIGFLSIGVASIWGVIVIVDVVLRKIL